MLTRHDKVWRAMRQLRSFDIRQLTTATETEAQFTTRYVRAMRRAGFLTKRVKKFVIVRNDGPKPPRVIAPGSGRPIGVFDPNTGIRYGLDGNAVAKRPGTCAAKRLAAAIVKVLR